MFKPKQPGMFTFVKLLRSVDYIKVGNRISSFVRVNCLIYTLIMVMFVSCIYYMFCI